MNIEYGEKARTLKKLTKFNIISWINYDNNGYNSYTGILEDSYNMFINYSKGLLLFNSD